MKKLMAGAGLAIMLLTTGAFAQQQGQQSTDDQKSFKNNVQGEPTTKKRQDIIRSESGNPDDKGAMENKATVGAGSEKKH